MSPFYQSEDFSFSPFFLRLVNFLINYKETNSYSLWLFTFRWLGEVWKWSGHYLCTFQRTSLRIVHSHTFKVVGRWKWKQVKCTREFMPYLRGTPSSQAYLINALHEYGSFSRGFSFLERTQEIYIFACSFLIFKNIGNELKQVKITSYGPIKPKPQ